MTADIQQMFYSFHVREDHRNVVTFLWYRDNDPVKDLIEYRMRVHVFGNSPSPDVATYALRKSVGLGQVTLEVKQFVEQDFYVDDGLTSVSTPEKVVALTKCTQETLMTNGNLRLHKIASNSDKVMNAFPVDDLAKDLKNLDFSVESLPQQRSLGLIWDLETNTFSFKVCTEEKPFTKRGILSTINSLFDPIGFVAPVVIQGKILVQQLISNKCDWDADLPVKDRHEQLERFFEIIGGFAHPAYLCPSFFGGWRKQRSTHILRCLRTRYSSGSLLKDFRPRRKSQYRISTW